LKKNMLLWSFCCSRISYWFSKYLSPMYLCIYMSIIILLMFLAPKHR
jgi:hypothetical protein